KLVLVNPFLPGGHTGFRNPTTLNLSAMPGYTRQKLLDTGRTELELLQDYFPGKHVQIGFWPINDSENANYGGKAAWDWIRDQLFLEFDGLNRPLVGFFQENLAAKRLGAGVDPFTATPVISQGITLRNPGNTSFSETTWAGFQMLG